MYWCFRKDCIAMQRFLLFWVMIRLDSLNCISFLIFYWITRIHLAQVSIFSFCTYTSLISWHLPDKINGFEWNKIMMMDSNFNHLKGSGHLFCKLMLVFKTLNSKKYFKLKYLEQCQLCNRYCWMTLFWETGTFMKDKKKRKQQEKKKDKKKKVVFITASNL